MSSRPRRVAIVGAGITGLSAAYYLERLTDWEVTLFERSPRLGGKIETYRESGLVVEASADSIFTRKPDALELIAELGMEGDLIEPQVRGFSMLIGGALRNVPLNLLAFGAIRPETLDEVGFLSAACKEDVLNERLVPPGDGADESIASFFRRRFGLEFSQKIAEPLLAGTHGGLPDKLSMLALYPNYLRMEREHGSLTAASARMTREGASLSTFVSLRQGLGSLTDALVNRLERVTVRNETVAALAPTLQGVEIDGTSFDRLVLAVPAHEAAHVLPAASAALKRIHAAATAVVTLGYHSVELADALAGTGFLVPFDEPSEITGATWSSSKWPDRAPSGEALIRVFLGREGAFNVREHTDFELRRAAIQALKPLLPLPAVADYVRVSRWDHALPQYLVGHLDRLEAIEESVRRIGPIDLIGQSYRGVGIPDCIRQAKELALQLA